MSSVDHIVSLPASNRAQRRRRPNVGGSATHLFFDNAGNIAPAPVPDSDDDIDMNLDVPLGPNINQANPMGDGIPAAPLAAWGLTEPEYRYRTVRQRVPRAQALARYGVTWGVATPSQRVARATDEYYGRGKLYRKRRRAYYRNPYSRRRRSKRRRYRRYRRRRRGSYPPGSLYRGTGSFLSSAGSWMNRNLLQPGINCARTIGSEALHSLGNAVGTGAIKTNNIINDGLGHVGDPIIKFAGASETGAIILSHTEFVTQVYGATSSNFTQDTYDINVGLEPTFNWLSSIAANYNEYEMIQLAFTFKPTIGDFLTTNGIIGTVGMAVQYNVKEDPWLSWNAMMTDVSAVSSKLTEGCAAGVECDPNIGGKHAVHKFIRTGGLTADKNIRNYDMAKLTFAQSNVNADLADQQIGELWVSYTVKLIRPTAKDVQGQAGTRSAYYSVDMGLNRITCALGETNTTGIGSIFDLRGPAFFAAAENMFDLDLAEICQGNRTDPVAYGLSVIPGGISEVTEYTTGGSNAPDGPIKCCLTPGMALNQFNPAPGQQQRRPLTITFPAQMSGIFELVFKCQVQSTTTPEKGFIGQFRCFVNQGSGIEPIDDMLLPETWNNDPSTDPIAAAHQWRAGYGTFGYDFDTSQSPSGARCSSFVTFVFHFKLSAVTQPAAGVPVVNNQIHLVGDFAPNVADGSIRVLKNASLDVHEYNALESTAGSNPVVNHPEIANVVTGAVYNP